MQSIHEIESAISSLSYQEYSKLRRWFEERDAQLWDAQFEQDVNAGKFDMFAERAIAEYRSGKAKEL